MIFNLNVTSGGSPSSVAGHQPGMVRTSISHDCPRNPTNGLAFIQQVNTSSSLPVKAGALIEFRSACNGTAHVVPATGNYIAATGSLVDQDLDDRHTLYLWNLTCFFTVLSYMYSPRTLNDRHI